MVCSEVPELVINISVIVRILGDVLLNNIYFYPSWHENREGYQRFKLDSLLGEKKKKKVGLH